jgi:hypothetical protein
MEEKRKEGKRFKVYGRKMERLLWKKRSVKNKRW